MRGSGPKPPAEFPPKSPDKLLNYVGSWFKASRRLEQKHTSKLRDKDDPRAKQREGERERGRRKLEEDEEGRQKELEVDERGQGHSCDEELRMKDVALVRL